MSDATLISWLLAFLAIGWVGGVVLGLRVGRANPSAKALEKHDEAVARELYRLVREHTGEPEEDDRG
ncbi:hypothetical protein GCM10027258_57710 [Amycolatopsis stemonae]